MSENRPPHGAASSDQTPTMQAYKDEQARLRAMIEKRNAIARRLAALDTEIENKESTYLEGTPNGNIITGFDNYIKGTGSAAAQRRKAGSTEQNRVFSRSSISYRPASEATTPGSVGSTPASHAPTPISTSFKDNGGSNHPTPTSATASKAGNKKKKVANDDDSEPDSQSTNKKRINFGATRK